MKATTGSQGSLCTDETVLCLSCPVVMQTLSEYQQTVRVTRGDVLDLGRVRLPPAHRAISVMKAVCRSPAEPGAFPDVVAKLFRLSHLLLT